MLIYIFVHIADANVYWLKKHADRDLFILGFKVSMHCVYAYVSFVCIRACLHLRVCAFTLAVALAESGLLSGAG